MKNENKYKYDREYSKLHVKRIPLDVQQTYFDEVLKPACDKLGLPVNTFIKQAIEHELDRLHSDTN